MPTALSNPSAVADQRPPLPGLTLLFQAHIQVGPAIELGREGNLRKRFIPITGGHIDSPSLKAEVLSGGGDWQSIRDGDGLTRVYARYTLKTHDGHAIGVTNSGIRSGPPDVIARMVAGERVDPQAYYFRTVPSFDVGDGPYGWMRDHIFLGHGIRLPEEVILMIYRID